MASNLGFQAWSMAMNHYLAEISVATEKRLANPHQILFALLIERNARPHASMNKEVISAAEKRNEVRQEVSVSGRNCGGQGDANFPSSLQHVSGGDRYSVGHQRRHAPQFNPVRKHLWVVQQP